MKIRVGFRPSGGAESSIQTSPSTFAPMSRKASRWASSRRRPIVSPPGGGISHLAEAGEQRAGDQERGADPVGELLVDLGAGDAVGLQADLVLARPGDLHAEPLEQPEHRLDVADPRHVADDELLVGEQAGGQDRERGVLVARRHDLSGERYAALDDEFLHGRLE